MCVRVWRSERNFGCYFSGVCLRQSLLSLIGLELHQVGLVWITSEEPGTRLSLSLVSALLGF